MPGPPKQYPARLDLRLSKEQLKTLDRLAKKRKTVRQELARQAIQALLDAAKAELT